MSGIDAIGGTPVVRLDNLPPANSAEVWVKLEGANPTGSYKDRMALAMIEGAERDGRLAPGQAVVEYTGGSTGSSLAYVCAVTGHPLRIVSSDAFAPEKIQTMRAFGADVELIPSPGGITPDLIPSMVRRAGEIARETGAFATDQFNNTDMIDGYHRLGEEVLEQLGTVDAFCCYVGTAGTHHVEGGGIGYWPPQLHADDFDEVMAIPEADGFAMARRAARADGIFSGPSTGVNLVAALRLAERLGPGHRVVTVQVDSGLKYLSGPLYTS